MQQQLSKPLWFYAQMQVLLGERLAARNQGNSHTIVYFHVGGGAWGFCMVYCICKCGSQFNIEVRWSDQYSNKVCARRLYRELLLWGLLKFILLAILCLVYYVCVFVMRPSCKPNQHHYNHNATSYRLAGKGLVSVRECASWKPRRKRYEPAFHKK